MGRTICNAKIAVSEGEPPIRTITKIVVSNYVDTESRILER